MYGEINRLRRLRVANAMSHSYSSQLNTPVKQTQQLAFRSYDLLKHYVSAFSNTNPVNPLTLFDMILIGFNAAQCVNIVNDVQIINCELVSG